MVITYFHFTLFVFQSDEEHHRSPGEGSPSLLSSPESIPSSILECGQRLSSSPESISSSLLEYGQRLSSEESIPSSSGPVSPSTLECSQRVSAPEPSASTTLGYSVPSSPSGSGWETASSDVYPESRRKYLHWVKKDYSIKRRRLSMSTTPFTDEKVSITYFAFS